MNVFSLFANAALAWRDRPAVRYGVARQTYGELAEAAAGFAAHLTSLGLRRGDRVALYMKNGFGYPAALLGAFRGGFVAVPVNAKLHPREFAYIVENAEVRVAVVDAEKADAVRAACGDRLTLVSAAEAASFHAAPTAPAECEPEELAWLFYTSGTTGRPKGAALSQRNLIAMSVNCLADICDFRPSDRLLHAAPLSHGSGLYLIPALSRGVENVIDNGDSFDPDRILRLVDEEGITVMPFLAPTMIVRLLDAHSALRTPTLRAIVYGGAPIHVEHLRAAMARFGPILTQLYGQGESPMTISYLPAWAHDSGDDEALQSAGFARAGVQIRIVDGDGGDAPLGSAGEIAVSGDVVMRGYWRNDEANAAAFSQGFLRTGDIGLIDARGRLRLLDRRHDMIISGGSNIYPREVEEVLTRHPSVKEAVVFGVSDPKWGESVAAAVVLREGWAADAETLIGFCRDNLASFKKPKRLQFFAELPKNAYGKVLRRELRDRFT